jgi:putative transposase
MNRVPFSPDEWYHCYTRGVDKRVVFENRTDYHRFVQLLYLSNSDMRIHRSDFLKGEEAKIFSVERGNPLVEIGAYCLMPNHFHILVKDLTDDGSGVSKFMQKVLTAFTMYFNKRRERVGNLFVKPFRAKHIKDDVYLRRVVQYIHFNPIELADQKWKQGEVTNLEVLERNLRAYPFSSLLDYEGASRVQNSVISKDTIMFLKDETPLKELLTEMKEYYKNLSL